MEGVRFVAGYVIMKIVNQIVKPFFPYVSWALYTWVNQIVKPLFPLIDLGIIQSGVSNG